jgi:hypothetical protein
MVPAGTDAKVFSDAMIGADRSVTMTVFEGE